MEAISVADSVEILVPERCRGCMASNKQMKSLFSGPYDTLFRDIANIIVSDSDGLPQWICWECVTAFRRFQIFKKKLIRTNQLLYDYLTRCLPVEADNEELIMHSLSTLGISETFVLETSPKMGKRKVRGRQYKNIEVFTSARECQKPKVSKAAPPVNNVPLVIKPEKTDDEGANTDDWPCDIKYEDMLHEADMKSDPDFSDPDDQPLLEKQHRSRQRSPASKMNKLKRLRQKKHKTKHKLKELSENSYSPEEGKMRRRNPRKVIEVDPTKIRVIKLTKEEQAKQREEDSKNDTYLKFPFKCTLCYKGFNYEQKLKNHMKKHERSRGPFECEICNMFLPTIYSYNVHEMTHSTRYECLKCGKKMIDKTSIMEHYSTVHEGVNITYICTLCGKSSSNSKTHRGHMRNHHSGDRPKCDQCGKTFVNKDSLDEHILIHTGVKNHECEQCGKRFRTKTQVKHHLLKHSDARDFYCVECDMRFKSAHNLKQHLVKSLRHVDVESLKHSCDRCEKRFDSERSLLHHVQFQHLGRRLHVCNTCGVALATRNSLMKHIRSAHEGYKAPLKHVCETCGKAFRARAVLVKHIRVHTGEKPYDCEHCGRKFSHRSAMVTHVKLVHLKIKRYVNRSKKPPPQPVSQPAPDRVSADVLEETQRADTAAFVAIPSALHPIITVKQEGGLLDQRRVLILQQAVDCDIRRPESTNIASLINVENPFYASSA